ncbi:MAG: hypothetical protein DRP87_12490 [Spirochaetes bacterium]|nr:MAG: hypothetical protein DRP87_12490 [Spirochaetota bacterium]
MMLYLSFLSYQQMMQEKLGKSNITTLYEMDNIPTDNFLRLLRDRVAPSIVFRYMLMFTGCLKRGELLSGNGTGLLMMSRIETAMRRCG